jgi:cytochrome c oxidase subunit I
MAMTETRPAPPAPAEAAAEVVPTDPSGLAGWLMTSDHRRIGRLWIAASMLFLVGGGVLGSLLGLERVQSGFDILDRGSFGQVYTLHGEITVLLFLVPLILGIATFVVPLQVGSPEIAFPRGSATAFWLYFVSGGILVASYLADGGPTGPAKAHEAIDLWLLALIGILVATVIALVSILTTIMAMRTSGLTLLRAPAFTWSLLVGGGLTLLTAPVLAARLVDMYVSHHFGASLGSYRGEIGWFWSVPQLYLLVVPAAGVALEIVPTLARNRFRMHAVALVLLGALGIVGIGAWAQVPNTFDDLLYVAIGIAPVLPALALLGLAADTLRGGRPALKAPLLFAMGTLLLLLLGAVAGALLVIDPLDLHGTVWEAGQMHLLLAGAATLGGLGALWWWAPKLWGVRLPEGAGVLVFLATFVGALLLAVPDLINGMAEDLPAGVTQFDDGGSVKALNGVSAAGGILVSVGAVIAVLALLAAARRRAQAATTDDPWGGQTLEWNDAALAAEVAGS